MVKIVVENKPEKMKDKLLEVTKKFLVEDNRRYFGKAAASLQNQIDDPKYKEYNVNAKVIGIGISGEKKTSLTLREWINDKPEIVLVDSISLPINSMEPEEDDEGQLDLGDTDHLLIIGNNLVIIDSKNWKAKTTYNVDAEKHEILRGKKSFKGGRPRIQECRRLWLSYYEDLGIENVYTFVCISDEEVNIVRDKAWWQVGYKLVNQKTLIHFLDKLYEKIQTEEKFIRIELVAQALTGLVKPYNKFAKFGAVYNLATGKKG